MRKTAAVTQKEKPVLNFSFIHYSDKVLFHAIVRGFTISMLQISKELVQKFNSNKQKYKMLNYR